MKKIRVGIVGCGNISGIYLKNLTTTFSKVIELVAVADLIPERSEYASKTYNVPKVLTTDELLNDPEVDMVLNLTTPDAHALVSLGAARAGKHIYCEKPLTITREEGQELLNIAKEKGLYVGNAPDTFLGAGIQTCRKLIDDGWIGTPVAATAFMTCHGHESWHPDPEFYYQPGAGPMFDMGPYYVTALVSLLGPVKRVSGSARITYPERIITSAKKYGKKIQVEVPTHVAGVLDFENGAVATIITSFDIWGANLPRIEIYGSEGTLSVPDPNTFGGPVLVKRHDQQEWREVPLSHGYPENSRGLGVADMAYAILNGRKNRASGELAYHCLDVMHGIIDASREGKYYEPQSTCSRPEPMEMGLPENLEL